MSFPGVPQAMRAAIDLAVVLIFTVSDDTASAMTAKWRQLMDGAFKTVKGMGATSHQHLKGFGVIIATRLAFLFHMNKELQGTCRL